MAAPSAVARQTPGGLMLEDGHSTKITVNADPDIEFFEKTVKPPGINGGDPIEVTTMHNVTWRTMAPRQLKTLTAITTQAGWDPILYTRILAQTNVEGAFTIRFPDGSTLAFYGILNNFEPGEHSEGNYPVATITITPTNRDPTTGAEEAPVLVNVPGT